MGIKDGDTVIVHLPFKSLGQCENDADIIVTSLLEIIGESGTLLFPTLCDNDRLNNLLGKAYDLN